MTVFARNVEEILQGVRTAAAELLGRRPGRSAMTNYRDLTKAKAAVALEEFLDERGPALERHSVTASTT